MNLYEHTIVARQDTSPNEIKQLTDKYSKIVEKNDGDIVQTENWGLMHLSYIIKKNRKGFYIHFKIKGNGKLINELEKNEKLDKNLLRYMSVKVKKFDLKTNYFSKSDDGEKRESDRRY
jgi:small subunit ribosomal protein S6